MRTADRGSHVINEMLQFSHQMFGASATAFSWVDQDLNVETIATYGLPAQFMDDYYHSAKSCDPLSARRLSAMSRDLLMLSQDDLGFEAAPLARYEEFLGRHQLGDEIQLLLRVNERPFAMLGLFHLRTGYFKNSSSSWSAFHRYMEHHITYHPRAMKIRYETQLARDYGFSAREIEVADMICFGASNATIAEALNIGLTTVKTHVVKILDKMGADSRTHLVAKILWMKN